MVKLIMAMVVTCMFIKYIIDQNRLEKMKATKGRVVYKDSKTKDGLFQVCVKDQKTGEEVILIVPKHVFDKYMVGDFFDEAF